jgi:hypothetical protein
MAQWVTERFSEIAALLGKIDPASHSAEKNTGYVDLANYARAVIIIHCGVIGGDVDVDIEEATSSAGAGAQSFDSGGKDVVKTATTDNNTVTVIEINSDELDLADGYHYLNVEATPASAGIFAVEIWGVAPAYAPVSTAALDAVVD